MWHFTILKKKTQRTTRELPVGVFFGVHFTCRATHFNPFLRTSGFRGLFSHNHCILMTQTNDLKTFFFGWKIAFLLIVSADSFVERIATLWPEEILARRMQSNECHKQKPRICFSWVFEVFRRPERIWISENTHTPMRIADELGMFVDQIHFALEHSFGEVQLSGKLHDL